MHRIIRFQSWRCENNSKNFFLTSKFVEKIPSLSREIGNVWLGAGIQAEGK